jgi:hypothetical protein
MRMRATKISGRESARLSVSSSRQVDEKRQIRTLDAHDLFADTPSRNLCQNIEPLQIAFAHRLGGDRTFYRGRAVTFLASAYNPGHTEAPIS